MCAHRRPRKYPPRLPLCEMRKYIPDPKINGSKSFGRYKNRTINFLKSLTPRNILITLYTDEFNGCATLQQVPFAAG